MPGDDVATAAGTEVTAIARHDLRSAFETLHRLRRLALDRGQSKRVAPIVRLVLRAIRNDDDEALRSAVEDLDRAIDRFSSVRREDDRPSKPSPPTPRQSDGRVSGGFRGVGGAVEGNFAAPLDARPPSPPSREERVVDRVPRHVEASAPHGVDPIDEGIVRVPHIDVDVGEPLSVGTSFTASVHLDKTGSHLGEIANLFKADAGVKDDTSLLIDVWLTASAHFSITGKKIDQITLDPTKSASSKAQFTVEVVDAAPPDAGPPTLRAMFDHRLRASGSVQRTFAISGAPALPLAPNHPSAVDLQPGRPTPDLQITIVRTAADAYHVRTQTALLGGVGVQDEWTLAGGADRYVTDVMGEFIEKDVTVRGRQDAMRGAGLRFFEEAPDNFRDLYWRLVDAHTPPTSILLMSEEGSVPWELMIPNGPDRTDADEPLGVQCAIGRWYGTDHVGPDEWIPLSDSLVLAPDYVSDFLPNAAAERDMVLGLFPGQSVPATYDELDQFYRTHSASLLHFACHGEDATLQSIRLLDHQKLSANQVRGGGLGAACRAKGPLVFLNACEVGRPGVGLSSPGGLAAALISAKCGAVIAPLWSVDDTVAHTVAVEFYHQVMTDPTKPFAEILRSLRARAYADGGADTYAAYCFYGHPLAAAVERPGS